MKKITLILALFAIFTGCCVDQVEKNNDIPGHVVDTVTVSIVERSADSLINKKQKK